MKRHRAKFGRVLNAELLYLLPGNQHMLPSWPIDMFTNQEAHLSFVVQVFIGASLHRHD